MTLTPYALALQLAAIKAELSGHLGMARAFREMLDREVRR